MQAEPHRLTRWESDDSSVAGKLFTCARPGRSKGSNVPIADHVVDAWVQGLPNATHLVIVSLLGRKPAGKSEFSFYSFRGTFDVERKSCSTFQDWLDHRYGGGRYRMLEYPTMDLEPISEETLCEASAGVLSLLRQGETVVLMDSGGFTRVQQLCSFMKVKRA